jgi:Ca2+-binding EF-hand superfamily protein
MLYEMKIEIPEMMLKELNRCLGTFPTPKFTFKTFTHYVARATLEEELEEEIRNLFYHIDRSKTGSIDAEDLMGFVRELSGGERMGEDEVNHLLKEMDYLKIGYLNYEDFVYLLLPK